MLFKKMIRDIKNHKIQFISIFLMAFLGVYVFVGFGAESFGLEKTAEVYYDETNLADGWIYSANIDNSFQNKVDNLTLTKDSEKQLVINSIADFKNDPDITLHFLSDDDISKFYLVKGEEFNLSDEKGVWLDSRFAKAKNLDVGDNISFTFDGMEIEKEIKGLGYSPEHLYQTSDSSMIPDFNKMGFAYLSYKAFISDNVPYNVLLVKYDGSSNDYEKILDDNLDSEYSEFVDRSQNPSFAEFQDETDQHKTMTDLIPLIFIVIAMLTLLTTMTRIINNQRTQIGILKALGFKNHTIMMHYISYGFWMVLLGSILGFILGPLTIPQVMFPEMEDLYSIPYWISGFDISFLAVTVIMVLLAGLISYFACRNIISESPSDAIKPKVPKLSSSGFLEKSKLWSHFSFNVRWNWRDAKRNKFRALMSIVGVLSCTLIIIASFGAMDGFEDMKEWSYEDINQYSSKLVIDNATTSQIDNIVDDVDGERLMESSIEIKSGDDKKLGFLTVLDENKLYMPTDDDRNFLNINDNDISISQKMADLLDVGIGDTVKWHIVGSDKWVETKITKVHSDPTSQGLIISKEKLNDLGLNYTTTSIITSHDVSDNNYIGVKTIFSINSLTESWDDMMESSMSIIYLLVLFATILSVIVLYNLGLLSFTEIKRELATLKVLGFKTADLRKLLLTQNLWFTTIGFLIGVPLGKETIQYMWGTMGDSFYLPVHLSFKTLFVTFIITYVVSILVNLMFSGKLKKLDMVESLKDNE